MKGIFILLLLGCISYVHGLECYTCFYHKNIPEGWFEYKYDMFGTPPSDKDCEKKPKAVMKCEDFTQPPGFGSLLKNKFGKLHNANMTTRGGGGEVSQIIKPICGKLHVKAGNKVYVERACTIIETDFQDTCLLDEGNDPYIGDYEEKACLCSTDKCNGAEEVGKISTLLGLAFIVIHGIC